MRGRTLAGACGILGLLLAADSAFACETLVRAMGSLSGQGVMVRLSRVDGSWKVGPLALMYQN